MNRIKELRIQKGYSQEKMAKLLGVAQASFSGWELDKWQPDYGTLIKLADYFGVTVDYLLGRDTIPTAPSPTKKNTVISIGRGGERREYEISDEDAALVDAFLEKMRKKD